MLAPINRFGGRDVTVGIIGHFTDFPVGHHCGLESCNGGILLCLGCGGAKSIGVRASRDNHGGIGVTLLHSLIVHNILGEVLSIAKIRLLKSNHLLNVLSIRVFESVFSLYDTGLGRKVSLSGHCALIVHQHLFAKFKLIETLMNFLTF